VIAGDKLGTPEILNAARDAWARHLAAPPPDDLPTQLGADSIAVAAHETALNNPSRSALEIDGAALTHGQLDERAGRMAGWLRRRGIRPDDVVLISAPSSLALIGAYLGSLRAGATVLLANPAYTKAELDYLAGDSGATLALAAGPGLARLETVARAPSELREVVDLARLSPTEPAAGSELGAAPPLEPVAQDPGRPAILAYTSGTTGKPKPVPLTDANVLSSIRA